MKYFKQAGQAMLCAVMMLCVINGFAQPEKLYRDLPVGEYAVGFQIISITDSTRSIKPELNYLGEKNEGNRYRQFTVHLWYPAVAEPAKSRLRVGDYTYNNLLQATNEALPQAAKNTRSETIRASIERWFGKPKDGDWQNFLQTSTLAIADAKPAPQKFPLLIGMLRPFSTSVTNEVMASNGYVVAMVSNPSFTSFSTAALGQVPDMNVAIHQLRHRFDESRIGVYGFSGSGFIPVLFSMFDQRVKALADLESGIYMDGLHANLAQSNYYVPAQLRVPFLHIFSRDLARQEIHLNELEQKTKFSKRYRLLLNQPLLHHWDFATEGYASATMLNLRGGQGPNIKRSFEISTLYLLHFFNAELKGSAQSRKFLSEKPSLPGTPDSLWSIITLQPMRPAPVAEELDYIIRKKGIDEALAIVKETLPNDSTTNLRQGFALNNLGYVFLREKKYAEAIGIFKLNTELHPGEANFFDSLSEAYETSGDSNKMQHTARQVLDLLAKKTTLSDAEKALKEQALKRAGKPNGPTGQLMLPPKRAHHELVYDEATQTILLTAGSTPLNGGQSFVFFNDRWSFDGTKWQQLGNAGDERSGIRMAFDAKRKKLFSFGGFANNNSLSDLRVMENGEWKTISNDTAMKAAEPGFVYDEHRDKLIAFGGSARRQQVNNITWEWDGKNWKKFGGEGPGARQGFAMVYDRRQKKTLVFGGMDAAGKPFTDDVWQFDGLRWEKISNTGTGPGPRLAPGYAYDSKKGVLLIFGGISNGEMKGDTWEWDGKKWKQLADAGPAPRAMGYMAYDKKRDKVVLFGGRRGWPNDVNDTWEWDGKEWKEVLIQEQLKVSSKILNEERSVLVRINYLDQKPPGPQAELFAPGIVSTNLYEHSTPAFSPDGKLVLWAVYNGNNYLLESRNQNGVWTKPSRPSFIDTLHGYVYPSFSADGKTLYFSSDRPVPASYRQGQGNRIWQVKRTDSGWSNPVPFDTTASQSSDYANAITNNGTLYFSSGLRVGTNWNLRRSEKQPNGYSQPVLLPYPLNSRDYEDGAYIAPDESFLIFESQRPEGTNGNLSLFISFKNKNGQWSLPVNIGPKINSGKGERFARLSPDGKYLFFGSFRNPIPGSRGADIYWIDASVIDELRRTKEATSFIEQRLGDSILAALDRRDTKASTVFLEQWLQLHPGHLDAMVLYSSMLRRQKRNTEATRLFTPFAEEWKTNNALVLEAALIQFGLGNEAAARALLTPVLAQPMDLRQKYVHLADELFAMQLYTLSDGYFEQAQAMRPQGVALYNRACAYALTGKKTAAFALLNKAIDNGFKSRKDFENDKDLQSLKEDPRWGDLQKRLNK